MQKQSVGPQMGQVTPKGSLVPYPMDSVSYSNTNTKNKNNNNQIA